MSTREDPPSARRAARSRPVAIRRPTVFGLVRSARAASRRVHREGSSDREISGAADTGASGRTSRLAGARVRRSRRAVRALPSRGPHLPFGRADATSLARPCGRRGRSRNGPDRVSPSRAARKRNRRDGKADGKKNRPSLGERRTRARGGLRRRRRRWDAEAVTLGRGVELRAAHFDACRSARSARSAATRASRAAHFARRTVWSTSTAVGAKASA